jgi:hypothetical protein
VVLVGLAVRTKVAKLPIRAILAILAMLILATLPIKVLSKLLLLLKVAKMAKEIGLTRGHARESLSYAFLTIFRVVYSGGGISLGLPRSDTPGQLLPPGIAV